MHNLTIWRDAYLPDCTLGQSLLDNSTSPRWRTMEPPWKLNADNESCIPEGEYIARKYDSPKHGLVWQLDDVPGRQNIQFHILNFASQTEGCIGLGLQHAIIDKQIAVSHSATATLGLMKEIAADDELRITIIQYIPPRIAVSNWR